MSDIECAQPPSSIPQQSKSRLWLFTLYGENLTEESMSMNTKISFMTYQLEKCPTTDRLHLQGVVRLKDRTTLNATKKILGHPSIHLVPTNNLARGIKYCNKTETRVEGPWTKGTPPHQGQRSDLAALAEQIVTGKRPREIATEDPTTYIRYHKGLQALSQAIHPAISHPDRRAVLLIGPTGCGKTRMAFDIFDESEIFIVPDIKTPWFDGYEQQRIAIVDECGTDMMHYNFLKRLTDRYPMQVPYKGGMCAWNAKTIILTAQQPMHTWWGDKITQSDINALDRRIKTFHLPTEASQARDYILDIRPVGATWGQLTVAPTLVDPVEVEEVHDLFDISD